MAAPELSQGLARLGPGCNAAYKTAPCGAREPLQPAPGPGQPSFQYCAQTYTRREASQGKYTTETEIQIFKLSTITITDFGIFIDFFEKPCGNSDSSWMNCNFLLLDTFDDNNSRVGIHVPMLVGVTHSGRRRDLVQARRDQTRSHRAVSD